MNAEEVVSPAATNTAERTADTTVSFASLNLTAPILQALTEEGYSTPTPIQAQAIPVVLAGHDLLGVAQTGTGKTAAFSLPLLHLLHTAKLDQTRRGPSKPRALILTPTRELATQIGDSIATYGRHTALNFACIYGGVSQFHQTRALRAGVDILVATPGRLEDLMEQRFVDLSQVSILVLDEADRMLDMGFIQPIRRIAAACPSPRQTLMFSATMAREIRQLADTLLTNPKSVNIAPVAKTTAQIDQLIYHIPRSAKQSLLVHLINESQTGCAIVFTKTKFGADRVERKLRSCGISAAAIHGNKAQSQRQRALDALKSGRIRVLVATDVAARGLDVDGISHVFNYDLPNEAESYVHRIGRTGRAGNTGTAIGFCDPDERYFLRNIERHLNRRIPTADVPDDVLTLARNERDIERAQQDSGDDNFDAPAPAFENRGRPRFERPNASGRIQRSNRFDLKPADRKPADRKPADRKTFRPRDNDRREHTPRNSDRLHPRDITRPSAPTHTPTTHKTHHIQSAPAEAKQAHTPNPSHAPKPAHPPKAHHSPTHSPVHTKPHAKPHPKAAHAPKPHSAKAHATAPHTPKPHAPKHHTPKPHPAATITAHNPAAKSTAAKSRAPHSPTSPATKKHRPVKIFTERPPEGQPLGPRRFGKKTSPGAKPLGAKPFAGKKSFGGKKPFGKKPFSKGSFGQRKVFSKPR